jgi:hypothetical protein
MQNNSRSRNSQLSVLFDADEIIGFKPDPYKLTNIPNSNTEYFVINPLRSLDNASIDNVATYRNILIELDKFELQQQEELIEEYLELPFTTKVFSGKKSYHYILSLEDPLPNLDAYKKLTSYIYAIVEHMDTACRNANRLSRLAGSLRSDGHVQALMAVNGRVSAFRLYNWIFNKWGHKIATHNVPVLKYDILESKKDDIGRRTKELIETGNTDLNSRHAALVKAAVDMGHAKWPLSKIELTLQEIAIKLGISNRGDVDGIIRWLSKSFRN